ncbi:hypothetical protein AMTR_s00051p00091260 [Amborella trichopoda]|uniref:Uncharacterized protein n=1 Tax=Amborella trichopoda TaxID=13333 RepID=U5D8E2_AMBTC|nr:hypothetical protein AMTR_s00051p00091260 [Amborella trichopoda]
MSELRCNEWQETEREGADEQPPRSGGICHEKSSLTSKGKVKFEFQSPYLRGEDHNPFAADDLVGESEKGAGLRFQRGLERRRWRRAERKSGANTRKKPRVIRKVNSESTFLAFY